MNWLAMFSPSRWAIALVSALGLAVGVWLALERADARGHARAQAQAATAAAQAAQQLREREADHAKQVNHLREDFYANTSTAHAAARAAKTQLDNLRLELDRLRRPGGLRPPEPAGGGATSPPSPAGPTVDDTATTLGQLLGQCAAEHQQLAEQTDSIADRLRALQAWAKTLKTLE